MQGGLQPAADLCLVPQVSPTCHSSNSLLSIIISSPFAHRENPTLSISHSANLTFVVNANTVGEYVCRASVPSPAGSDGGGSDDASAAPVHPSVTASATVHMKGPPRVVKGHKAQAAAGVGDGNVRMSAIQLPDQRSTFFLEPDPLQYTLQHPVTLLYVYSTIFYEWLHLCSIPHDPLCDPLWGRDPQIEKQLNCPLLLPPSSPRSGRQDRLRRVLHPEHRAGGVGPRRQGHLALFLLRRHRE